jgi:hypothetical protein
MFEDTLIRAAKGMIRNHGDEAETKATQRASSLERFSREGAEHWREVARVVRVLKAHIRAPIPADPLSRILRG